MSLYEIPSDQLSAMEAFAKTNNDPIVMVNLLKIRDRAEYPPDSSAKPCSGREAFARYQEGSRLIMCIEA